MGFFDSLASTVGNGAKNVVETATKTNWEKMRNMDERQLSRIYEEKGLGGVGTLAYLLLCRTSSVPEISEEDVERIKRNNTFLMGVGREFDEIRDAIDELKRKSQYW